MTEPKKQEAPVQPEFKHRLLFSATVVFAILDKDKQPTQQGSQTLNVLLSLKAGEDICLNDIGRVQVNAQKRVFDKLGGVDVLPIDVVINSMCDLGWSTDEQFEKGRNDVPAAEEAPVAQAVLSEPVPETALENGAVITGTSVQ